MVHKHYDDQEWSRYHEFVINKSLKDGLMDIKQQGDNIILVKLLGDLILHVISTYTPKIGIDESIKRQF
jgi:hypothetical protein